MVQRWLVTPLHSPCPFPFPCSPFPYHFHRAFFSGVNLCLFIDWKRLAEEEPLDVIEEEILRVRAGEIQSVMIDYLRLFLQPGSPAGLTDLLAIR